MEPAQTTAKVTPLRDGDGIKYREPPANLEAEQALLGAVLVNNAAYHRVGDFLLPEHFAEAVHGRIYERIGKLIERGQIANPVTLKNVFDQDGALAEIGGGAYLARLAAAVITVVNAEDYARTIHDLYLRRQLIEVGETVVNDAYRHDTGLDAAEQIQGAEKRLFDLAETGRMEGGFQPFLRSLTTAITMAEAAFKRSGKTTGVSTGFTDLDKLLGGLHPSDLVILAGRPSMGKTALATNIGFNAAKLYKPIKTPDGRIVAEDGAVVGFFSMEMSAEQLATRVLAEESGISGDRIRRGDVSHDDFDKFVQASQRLASVPLYIDDTPALSIAALRTRARRLKRQQGLDLIIVDYLQLMQAGPSARGPENRVQEISEITRGLKAVAKDLNVPVIALSQLSRAVEQREDKRPQLADLRESGSIEQDADAVMFVYRDEYYLEQKMPKEVGFEGTAEKFNAAMEDWQQRMSKAHNRADLIIAKQRHGPTGTIPLLFEGEFTRFGDLDLVHTDYAG
jgi:replicative DNA helicase